MAQPEPSADWEAGPGFFAQKLSSELEELGVSQEGARVRCAPGNGAGAVAGNLGPGDWGGPSWLCGSLLGTLKASTPY